MSSHADLFRHAFKLEDQVRKLVDEVQRLSEGLSDDLIEAAEEALESVKEKWKPTDSDVEKIARWSCAIKRARQAQLPSIPDLLKEALKTSPHPPDCNMKVGDPISSCTCWIRLAREALVG